jgi:RNA polymerase sigma-70 factor (ECF subfamily)
MQTTKAVQTLCGESLERLSDEELVDRTLAGDRCSFEEIVSRYREPFGRLARRYLDDDSDIEDAVQKTLVKIHDKLDTFRGESRFKRWAFRILVNTALGEIRRERRRREVALEDVRPSLDGDDVVVSVNAERPRRAEDAALDRELREQLAEAIDELAPKYRRVFWLYEFEGLSLDEISSIIGLTVPGTKTRLHRARKSLRVSLTRYISA